MPLQVGRSSGVTTRRELESELGEEEDEEDSSSLDQRRKLLDLPHPAVLSSPAGKLNLTSLRLIGFEFRPTRSHRAVENRIAPRFYWETSHNWIFFRLHKIILGFPNSFSKSPTLTVSPRYAVFRSRTPEHRAAISGWTSPNG